MADGPSVGGGFRGGFGGCFGVLAAVIALFVGVAVLGKLGSPSAPEASSTGGAVASTSSPRWNCSSEKSKLTDQKNVYCSVESLEEFGAGYQTHRADLMARCVEGKVESLINFDSYLGLETTTVRYRVDQQKLVSSEWSISTNTKAAFAPGAKKLLAALSTAKQLVVRATPYGENPVEVTFNVGGFDEGLAQIRDACKWRG